MFDSNTVFDISEINIYCDESCHLENDKEPIMALGCIKCPADDRRQIYKDIRNIKIKHKLSPYLEIKWTKVSESKIDFYKDLIDYFFDNELLTARVLIVSNKGELDHSKFDKQSHNNWYSKMYYILLKYKVSDNENYNVYLDIKDTISNQFTKKLEECLNNSFGLNKFNLQIVRSDEIELVQLIDLIIGAIAYENRGLLSKEGHKVNMGKKLLIDKIKSRAGYSLSNTNYNDKLNIFIFRLQESNNV